MNKFFIVVILAVLVATIGIGVGHVQAANINNKTQTNDSPWWCPWCGMSSEGYGPGGYYHMYGYGRGRGWGGHMMVPGYWGMMGPGYGGMMGPGYWGPGQMMGPGYSGSDRWRGYGSKSSEPLTKEDATKLLKRYIRNTNNPNLKLGKVTEGKKGFVGEVTTKDGSLVDKIEVNKNTGWMRPAR
jgi:hypothetical protein